MWMYATAEPARTLKIARTISVDSLVHERVCVDRLKEDDTCMICLSTPHEDLSEDLMMPQCGHCMHVACAEAWLANHLDCPLCRQEIATDTCTIWQLFPSEGSTAATSSPENAVEDIEADAEETEV